jgi:nitrogen-specific signal transduction histidine kinase
MEQVLMNLFLNARNSMPKGGAVVLITGNLAGSASPKEVFVLEVKDAGVGMKASLRKRIFEPFFTTKTEGTGLGLADRLLNRQYVRGADRSRWRAGYRLYVPHPFHATRMIRHFLTSSIQLE